MHHPSQMVTYLPFDTYSLEEFEVWKAIVFRKTDRTKTKEEWLQMAHYYLATEEYLNAQVCLTRILKQTLTSAREPYVNFLLASIIALERNLALPKFNSISKYNFKRGSNYSEDTLNSFEDYLIDSIDLGYYRSLQMIPLVKGHYKKRIFEDKFEKWKNNIRGIKTYSDKCYFTWLLFDSFKHFEKLGKLKIKDRARDALESAIIAGSTDAILKYYFIEFGSLPIKFDSEKTILLNKICRTHLEKLITDVDQRIFYCMFRCNTREPNSLDNIFGLARCDLVDKYISVCCLTNKTSKKNEDVFANYKTEKGVCPCKAQIEKGKNRLIYECWLCREDTSDEKYRFNKKQLKHAAKKESLLELIPSLRKTFYSLAWSYDYKFYATLYDYQIYYEFLEYAYCTAHFYRSPEKSIVLEILDIKGLVTPFNVKHDKRFSSWSVFDYSKSLIDSSKIIEKLLCYVNNKIVKYSKRIHNQFGDGFLDDAIGDIFKKDMQDVLYKNNIHDAIVLTKSMTRHLMLDIGNSFLQKYARTLDIGFELLQKYIDVLRKNNNPLIGLHVIPKLYIENVTLVSLTSKERGNSIL